MAFDLELVPPRGGPRLAPASLAKHFSSRPHYTVESDYAYYSNPDSGVYFWFNWDEETEDGRLAIVFSLNLMRPPPFVREAEAEVRELVERFLLRVERDGSDEVPYDDSDWVARWTSANETACRALTRHGTPEQAAAEDRHLAFAPLETIEHVWAWNAARNWLQERAYVFIPKVQFARVERQLVTVATWTDLVPIVFPEVDYLAVLLTRVAAPGVYLTPLSSIRQWLEPGPRASYPLPTHNYPADPDYPELAEHVQQQPFIERLDVVPFEDVLPSEYAEPQDG